MKTTFLLWMIAYSKLIGRAAAEDVCYLTNNLMFCNCEPTMKPQEVEIITCRVFSEIDEDNSAWPAFKELTKLKSLHISSRGNLNFTYIPRKALEAVPSLEKLTIQSVNMKKVNSNSVTDLDNLIEINLERTYLHTLEPHSFENLPGLRKLYLSDNFIGEINQNTFVNLPNLTSLILDRNNIRTLDDCAFCGLNNLEELDLSQNNLTKIRKNNFKTLTSLKSLGLFRNKITAIEEGSFSDLSNLKELDLKDNLLSTLSSPVFKGLQNLGTIYLQDNQLLSLQNNVFKECPNLHMIDLSSNQIATVDRSVLEGLKFSKSEIFALLFKNNPLVCSCDLSWIPEFIKESESQLLKGELKHSKCAFPNENTTVKVINADLKCEVPTTSATHPPTVAITSHDPSLEFDVQTSDSIPTEEDTIIYNNLITPEPHFIQKQSSAKTPEVVLYKEDIFNQVQETKGFAPKLSISTLLILSASVLFMLL